MEAQFDMLPRGYHVKDGEIFHGERPSEESKISNFLMRVTRCWTYEDDPDAVILDVQFRTKGGQETKQQIPVSALNDNNLLRYIPGQCILFEPSRTNRLSFVRTLLNLQRSEIDSISVVRRVSMGYHNRGDGQLFYCLGDKIINAPSEMQLEVDGKLHLRKFSPSNKPPVMWVWKYCRQGLPQAAQFLSTMTAFIRPILKGVNINEHVCIYAFGESSTGKSEFAKLLCNIFEEKAGVSLSSDKSDIFRQMSSYRDMPFLVDDYNDSRIASASNKKRERLSEIIQPQSGGGKLVIKGETFDIDSVTPTITAEKLLKSYSTINRTILIEYDKIFKEDDLTWLQNNQGLYTTLLEDFIQWICVNHRELKDKVANWRFDNLSTRIQNPKAYVGLPRLNRTYQIIKITEEMFIMYLKDKYKIPPDNENKWRNQLDMSINQCVQDTLEHIRKESPAEDRCYVDEILDIFAHRYELFARSYEEYKKVNKNAVKQGLQKPALFFRYGDCFCIRGDDLLSLFKYSDKISYLPSKKTISAQLDFYELLRKQGGELSYPLNSKNKTRYYHFKVTEIVRQVIEKYSDRSDMGMYRAMSPVNELRDTFLYGKF